MIKFDTKFDLNDLVCYKKSVIKHQLVECPFCHGNKFVWLGDEKIECGNCNNGVYDHMTEERVWSEPHRVIGVIARPFTKYRNGKIEFEYEPKIVLDNDSFSIFGEQLYYQEDELAYADDVKDGEPCD